MNTSAGFDKCLTFINCHLQPPIRQVMVPAGAAVTRAITISRQSGCGAHVIAERLADCLQRRLPGSPRWTIFDRNLVEQVLADHHLPERLARFMPEDRVLQVDDMIDEILGLHPPSFTFAQQTAETISRLAEMGNVIIVGRGANIITAGLPDAVHVRIVASLERRIEHMMHFERLNAREARDRIHREDLGRQRYVKTHFGRNVEDPLLYHLVINTDLVGQDNAARLIAETALGRRAQPTRSA